MKEMEEVIRIFPQRLRTLLQYARTQDFQAEELRLRVNQPILMEAKGQEWRLLADGSRWKSKGQERLLPGNSGGWESKGQELLLPGDSGGWESKERKLLLPGDSREWERMENGAAEEFDWERRYYQVTAQDIRDTLEYMSRYSLYAFDEELRQGYLTIPGGHRIGLAGQAVVEKGRIKTLRNISFLNIRVAREIKGCADDLLPWLYSGKEIGSSLIISPPRCGKTTLLRDLIRQVSDGWQASAVPGREKMIFPGRTVGVVDERSELGACYQGVPQHDLGKRTDVLDHCPKAEGIMMLIRSMAPRVVAVDEIGSREDIEALQYGINCGCRILATVHGSSLEDILRKPSLRDLVESGVFTRYVLLQSQGPPGRIRAVFDGERKRIGKEKL